MLKVLMAIGDTFKTTTNEHLEAWANQIDKKSYGERGIKS